MYRSEIPPPPNYQRVHGNIPPIDYYCSFGDLEYLPVPYQIHTFVDVGIQPWIWHGCSYGYRYGDVEMNIKIYNGCGYVGIVSGCRIDRAMDMDMGTSMGVWVYNG